MAAKNYKNSSSEQRPLGDLAEQALNDYLETLDGHRADGLYGLFIGEVEKPLFRTVMRYTEGNQSRAAQMLGINRGTLRKKLKEYALLER